MQLIVLKKQLYIFLDTAGHPHMVTVMQMMYKPNQGFLKPPDLTYKLNHKLSP